MIECCLVVVCFCLLHDTNLGPTLPAGGLPAFSVYQLRRQANKAGRQAGYAEPLSEVAAPSSFRQKRGFGSSKRRQHNNIIMVQLGSNLSTCELRNHCRSDPVQVQSTMGIQSRQPLYTAVRTPRCFNVGPKPP